MFEATREVIRPALFGVFIITAIVRTDFRPRRVEGKMFHPMAITVVIALLSAILLSVTFVPAAVALMFKGPVTENTTLWCRHLRACISHWRWPLQAGAPIIGLAAVLVLLSIWQATRLGSEFAPNLDEGDIAMHALRIPGTSLSQAIALQETLEERIKALPEVERVFAKIGTADVATDAVPPECGR